MCIYSKCDDSGSGFIICVYMNGIGRDDDDGMDKDVFKQKIPCWYIRMFSRENFLSLHNFILYYRVKCNLIQNKFMY